MAPEVGQTPGRRRSHQTVSPVPKSVPGRSCSARSSHRRHLCVESDVALHVVAMAGLRVFPRLEPPEPLRRPPCMPRRVGDSNAVTRGFNKPHGMALELVYRAENRCKSSGAPAGAFPKPPRGRVGPGSGPKSTISGPTPATKKRKTLLTALEAS